MKKLLLFTFVIFCAGCATLQNPYSEFYQDRTGGIDVSKSPMVILPTGEPKIFSGNNIDQDAQKMYEDGYNLLGFSSFNAGNVGKDKLIHQAKKVKAEVIVFYSKYTNTLSGVVPLTLPDNHTITTNYSGMGNSQGNIYGSNGGWASYHGTSNAFGQATTTIYDTKTTYIPYSQNRYDYLASYWIKMKKPILGVMAIDLTSEQRAKIGTNKGAYVTIVVKDSPAFMADIFKGDIITKISEDEVVDAKSLNSMASKYFGKKVVVTIIRDDKTLTKEIQFSEGEKIQDVKYGSIAESYCIFRNTTPDLNKTALIHFDKIFDAYHKSKEYGFTWEEVKANPDKGADPRALSIFNTIREAISDFGKKNQYRAIFSYKLPNINESEDLTDTIISIVNSK